jgi:hypothetical protein
LALGRGAGAAGDAGRRPRPKLQPQPPQPRRRRENSRPSRCLPAERRNASSAYIPLLSLRGAPAHMRGTAPRRQTFYRSSILHMSAFLLARARFQPLRLLICCLTLGCSHAVLCLYNLAYVIAHCAGLWYTERHLYVDLVWDMDIYLPERVGHGKDICRRTSPVRNFGYPSDAKYVHVALRQLPAVAIIFSRNKKALTCAVSAWLLQHRSCSRRTLADQDTVRWSLCSFFEELPPMQRA